MLVVQYSNPAAYPPMEHASRLLADAGYTVALRGLGLLAGVTLEPHPHVEMRLQPPAPGGLRQKLGFARFMAWIRHEAARLRPDWIYVSDPLAAPAAWLAGAGRGVRCVYHEHDAPGHGHSAAIGLVMAARRRIARRADVCVVPSHGRRERLVADTGRETVIVAWNTPLLDEVASPEPAARADGRTRLLFHGSIVPARVPETLLHALARLPRTVTCCLTGYDPSGGGYLAHLRVVADGLGLGDRLEFAGTIPSRRELLARCGAFDVGLSLLPRTPDSFNEETMLGASNKPFDYLARGLALIVPDRPDWREVFVVPGYGVACDPASVESLAAAVLGLHERPVARRQMGLAGRARILADWHYERAFAPVLAAMRAAAEC